MENETYNGTYRNWQFTFYVFEEEQMKAIKAIDDKSCKYIIFCEEYTKEGRFHLQGYIELNKPSRMPGVKKILDPRWGIKSQVRVKPATHGREFNKRYCSKGIQSHEEYNALGTNGPNYGHKAVIYEREFKKLRENQGTRTDWNDLYDFIRKNPDYSQVLAEYPEYAIKYSNGIQKAIDAVKNENNLEILKESLSDLKLFKWELELEAELKNKPNNRKIIWYLDEAGGCGKTTFAKYLLAKGNCTYFTNSKSADIARAYKGERTAIFDFTRSIEGRVNYSAVEQIKNGLTFSSKYDSGHKINAIPHVICLSNFAPDISALSADRWDIRTITKDDCKIPPCEIPQATEIPVSTATPVIPEVAKDNVTNSDNITGNKIGAPPEQPKLPDNIDDIDYKQYEFKFDFSTSNVWQTQCDIPIPEARITNYTPFPDHYKDFTVTKGHCGRGDNCD